ncbi:hypothetical protein N9729_01230 [bacterium]|nr:hypothetical protein [bacterium]
MPKCIELSKTFWITMSISYAFCFSALYAYATLPEHLLDPNITAQNKDTLKLSIVRLMIVSLALIAYPIVLFKFIKYAKYVTVALTSWATTMYIDDYFVLVGIVEYPDSGLISLVQSIRPIIILSLLWMSFELIFRSQKKV